MKNNNKLIKIIQYYLIPKTIKNICEKNKPDLSKNPKLPKFTHYYGTIKTFTYFPNNAGVFDLQTTKGLLKLSPNPPRLLLTSVQRFTNHYGTIKIIT